METKWAEENLQTIRTLMERSAVYRRALAPIMIFAGVLGVLGAMVGLFFHLDSMRAFGLFWLGTALVTVIGALLITRRQAMKDKEAFWSPPTRRVAQALAVPLLAGMFLSAFPIIKNAPHDTAFLSAFVWILFYGLALHASGFFMPRGIKFFGWFFIISGCGLFCIFVMRPANADFSPHWLMGFFFGVLHLAYGAYLYLTEKKNPVA